MKSHGNIFKISLFLFVFILFNNLNSTAQTAKSQYKFTQEQIDSQQELISYLSNKTSKIKDEKLNKTLISIQDLLIDINNLAISNNFILDDYTSVMKYENYLKEINKLTNLLPLSLQTEIIDLN